jgi:polyhydroxyalkanoate synthesis regulator phasin|tara:strand:+ start:674 stop:904 length:231 start_codon:yes stop_codon:yes gene_type:complete
MSDKDLSEALKNIIEKELKAFSKLLPADIVSNIEKKVSPQVEKIINQSGYIKKSKYENLEKIINDLEKRITELEKN